MGKTKADILWNKKYTLAKIFFKKYGHLLIPYDYMIDGIRLGRWIGTQRQNYIKRDNSFFTQEKIEKLNQIGMVWDVKKAQWESMYLVLKKYKEKYGNIRVPQSHITESGIKLGIWMNKQRLDYSEGKLSLERQKKLEELDIIWNPRHLITEQWMKNFLAIQEYKNTHNHFPTISYIDKEGVRLGCWLAEQRNKYSSGKLLPEREKLLMDLGALGDFYKEKWNKWYSMAKLFYKQNGHLSASKRNSLYPGLENFLSRQRKIYRMGKLSPKKIKLLEEINISWNPQEEYWDKMYRRLRKFYKENGTLFISKEKSVSKDYHLALWMESQRRLYRKNPNYHPLHVQKLNSIGFVWNPYRSPDEIWNAWYQKAKAFYEKNHHLKPKKGQLATWIFAQRAARKGLRGTIFPTQIALLDEIEMIWNFKEEHWEKMYQYAREYYQIHELLNIPTNYITYDGARLGMWISRQRKVYKDILKGKVKMSAILQKRIQLLNKIAMIWDASKISVRSSFQEKAIFYYLHQFFPDTVKMTQWEFIGYELDIYIPSIRIAIEYDGIWHQDSLEKDNLKNKACLKHNIRLIRLREVGLPSVSWCKDIIFVKSEHDCDFEKALQELFSLLHISFSCTISKDRSSILQIYKDYTSHVFDRNYEKLYSFYQKYGPLYSSFSFAHLNKELKCLVSDFRSSYKNGLLTSLQVKKLNKIGFVFNLYEKQWQYGYKQAICYYQKYKDLKVPYSYVTSSGFRLGSWLSKQRCLFYQGNLDFNRRKFLEAISIDWYLCDYSKEGVKRRRNAYFSKLKEYYKIYGNIDIKRDYVTKDGYPLGKWLGQKRSEYKKGLLNQETFSVLDSLKMKWNFFDDKWEDMFLIAKAYYLKHGNIFISPNYVTEEGIHLGAWISRQRKRRFHSYRGKSLTQEQIDLLNLLHMRWDPYHEKWMEKYQLAKNFYKTYGHLNIPISYITEEGVKLGMWIGSQRQANRGNPNFLMTPERKQLLDEIHMNWTICHPHPNSKRRK